jgi:hypothetical protein
MKVPWLKTPLAAEGPFLSVHLDTTRTDPNAASELSARWHVYRGKLSADGAPTGILDRIEDTVLSPSPIGGRHGRTILATPDGILLDRVLPVPPREAVAFGPHPMLLPLLHVVPYAVSQLLIEVDRSGADIHLRAPEDPTITPAEADRIDGGHDELHKASVGGGSQHGWRTRDVDARVEDSWERNAAAVGRKVDALVAKHRPDMVLLTGDVRETALLQDALGQDVRDRLQHLSGGTRGVSMQRPAFREELERVTGEFVVRRRRAVADALHEDLARGGTAVTGRDEVATTLERGQVEDLVLLIGQEPDDIEDLARRAIMTDAGICPLDPDDAAIPEGVGAFLRWRDEATPSDGLASMAGDPALETQPHV